MVVLDVRRDGYDHRGEMIMDGLVRTAVNERAVQNVIIFITYCYSQICGAICR